MTDETRFEERLARALRDFADQAVLPFDASEIADRAIEARPAALPWIRLAMVATLGMAAVVVAVVVAAQSFIGPVGIGNPLGGPDATPRVYAPEDLPNIALSEANALDGMTIDYETRTTGVPALVTPLAPGGETIDTTHFVDALSVELGTSIGGFTTWSALFESPEAAAEAYAFLITEHESPDGWDLAASREDPDLGDESALWTGQQYDHLSARTIVWRQGNLILAAVGWADWEPEEVRLIADQMADRAK
jgi:hypothetical protein